MSWFKMDDRMHDHPKARKAGIEAIGLWALAGTYTADYKLDGFIPLHYVTSWPKGKTAADRLVNAGLWHPNHPQLDCDCLPDDPNLDLEEAGWRMHDYLDYNPDSATVERGRDAARARQQRLRDLRHQPINGTTRHAPVTP